MINNLDETIKQLLIKKGRLDPAEIDIVFDMPDREWSSTISKPTVNVYLYDIHENPDKRDNEWTVVHRNGKATKTKTPNRIDLSYLVTVWTNDTADQHSLLSHILATLFRYPEIPEDLLQGNLADSYYPIKAKVAQPDGVFRNSADFWSALDNQLKPSISYVLTIPVDLDMAITAPEVKTKVFKFTGDGGQGPEERISISGLVHRKGKAEEALTGVAILAREAGVTATTNEEGKYAFSNLSFGSHTLEVTAPGEKTKEVPITVPGGNYDIEI
ncbi:MAG: Pvc16 family protein [Dehalococcoidia bacterium]